MDIENVGVLWMLAMILGSIAAAIGFATIIYFLPYGWIGRLVGIGRKKWARQQACEADGGHDEVYRGTHLDPMSHCEVSLFQCETCGKRRSTYRSMLRIDNLDDRSEHDRAVISESLRRQNRRRT